MEILLYILGGLILVIGIIVAVYILFQIVFQIFFKVIAYVIAFVVGFFVLAVVICGLAMVVNYCHIGTPFGNGMGWSEGIHYVMESTHTESKVSPKASKGDLSVKEIEAPKQVESPHQIEGAKEVKK